MSPHSNPDPICSSLHNFLSSRRTISTIYTCSERAHQQFNMTPCSVTCPPSLSLFFILPHYRSVCRPATFAHIFLYESQSMKHARDRSFYVRKKLGLGKWYKPVRQFDPTPKRIYFTFHKHTCETDHDPLGPCITRSKSVGNNVCVSNVGFVLLVDGRFAIRGCELGKIWLFAFFNSWWRQIALTITTCSLRPLCRCCQHAQGPILDPNRDSEVLGRMANSHVSFFGQDL